jgi:hypothetical protein
MAFGRACYKPVPATTYNICEAEKSMYYSLHLGMDMQFYRRVLLLRRALTGILLTQAFSALRGGGLQTLPTGQLIAGDVQVP